MGCLPALTTSTPFNSKTVTAPKAPTPRQVGAFLLLASFSSLIIITVLKNPLLVVEFFAIAFIRFHWEMTSSICSRASVDLHSYPTLTGVAARYGTTPFFSWSCLMSGFQTFSLALVFIGISGALVSAVIEESGSSSEVSDQSIGNIQERNARMQSALQEANASLKKSF